MIRRALVLPVICLGLGGCAQLVGADFSDLQETQAGAGGGGASSGGTDAGGSSNAGEGGTSGGQGGDAGAAEGGSGGDHGGKSGDSGASGSAGDGGSDAGAGGSDAGAGGSGAGSGGSDAGSAGSDAGSGGSDAGSGGSGAGGGGSDAGSGGSAGSDAGQGGSSGEAGTAGEGGQSGSSGQSGGGAGGQAGAGGQSFEHCKDGETNGDETDTDCGGSCKPCDHEKACKQDGDCFSGSCQGQMCLPQCPADMVLITDQDGVFCIDSREVSQAQYSKFLASIPSLEAQDAICSFNKSFQPENNSGGSAACGPSSYDPVLKGDRPVVCVDWCDAQAYCRAQGKRLCGRIQTGGTLLWDFASKWAQDEWYRACSGETLKYWPYGDTYDSQKCNGKDAGKGTTVPVTDLPGCEGGYPGIFHMAGNAIEWMDSCKEDPGKQDLCLIRGGSFFDSSTTMSCGKTFSLNRDSVASDVGFRCCGG